MKLHTLPGLCFEVSRYYIPAYSDACVRCRRRLVVYGGTWPRLEAGTREDRLGKFWCRACVEPARGALSLCEATVAGALTLENHANH